MEIFWRLVLAHFIADFTLQTNRIASWKRESRWGMFAHILTHPLVTLAVVVLPRSFVDGSPWNGSWLTLHWVATPWFSLPGWVCISLIAIFHWLEDEWRVWSIQKTGSPDSTGFFLWDQVVHLTIILAVSPAIPGMTISPWVLPVLCAVLLAHFVSVLIYFIENDLWGASEALGAAKYRFIGERFVGAGLFLLPGAWFLLAGGWIGWVAYLQLRKSQERTWVHLVIGNASVVLLGLLARGLLS
jgi:hypothetical protein